MLRRDPHTCGLDRSRWRLVDLLACCPWVRLTTPQSLGRLLQRVGIASKRGRDDVHSPDPDDDAKLAVVAAVTAATTAAPGTVVVLYLDEVARCRQPTLACAWEASGPIEPRAVRGHASDTVTRIVGALDATTGELQSPRATKITIGRLLTFLIQVVAAYPDADQIWIVLDNWPVHDHPDVLAALEPQRTPFPLTTPGTWPTTPRAAVQQRWEGRRLPIQLVPLPTSASWCNPIEQVWRKLRQELGHVHPWAADLDRPRTELDAWLVAYQQPSPTLLRYVGLEIRE